MNPRRSLPVLAAVLLTACVPQNGVSPSPEAGKLSTSPWPTVLAATPSPIPAPSEVTPLSLSAIQRLNSRVGYIAGWSGTGLGLAKTSDDGATWQRISIPADHLTALRFIDERVGWMAGFENPNLGVVLRTADGGQTWQTVLTVPSAPNPGGDPIEQIQAVDGQRAWALTAEPASCQNACPSNLRRTTDGGATWTVQLRGQIAAIRFASATRGWVALDDTASPGTVEVRETSDGGITWRVALRTTTGGAFGLDAATIYRAWLLTRDGAWCSSSDCSKYALFRTDDGGLTWSNLGNPKDFAAACSGGHLAGPLFASPGRGWLGLNLGAGGAKVGPGGILKSEDGGATWRCTTTPPNINLVSAADPLHMWAAGEDRLSQSTVLYATEDGGATWRPLNLSSLR